MQTHSAATVSTAARLGSGTQGCGLQLLSNVRNSVEVHHCKYHQPYTLS